MKVFIIAGEKSGDLIGAKIIQELKLDGCNIYGIGGSAMLEAGLSNSLFDISEISIMGFAEVIPKALKISKLINQTVSEVARLQPDVVITIDSPGFNTRVVSKLKKLNFTGKLVHVVAPTVWAYKPKRAIKFAHLFDKLFCILPFEPPYFIKHGLYCKYVGYPPLERLSSFTKIQDSKKYIVLALGSRRGEIIKHIEFANEMIAYIKAEIPDAIFVIPTFAEFKQELSLKLQNVIIASTEEEKTFFMQRAAFGIYKSGTGAVEASICGIPIVIFYKASFISYLILKALVKIKYANLINILLNKQAIPEFLQFDCNAKMISSKVIFMLQNPNEIKAQLEDVKTAIDLLKTKQQNFARSIVQDL